MAKGEKGQGMAINIIAKAMENQTNMIRNFWISVWARLAIAEPMVIKTMAVNIKVM